jgi:hypothetical protein
VGPGLWPAAQERPGSPRRSVGISLLKKFVRDKLELVWRL